MSKPRFGLADFLTKTEKIYYENIFSMHQIGRIVDLLCAIASEATVETSALRCALTASLAEACRSQALDEKIPAGAKFSLPVSVEFGFNSEKVFAAIGFSSNSPEEEKIKVIGSWTESITLKTEKSSDLCEIQFSLPVQALPAELKTVLNRAVIDSDDASQSGDAGESEGPFEYEYAEREYVELGDVEYTRLLDSGKSSAKKLLAAATQGHPTIEKMAAEPEESADEAILDQGLSNEGKSKLLAESDPGGAAALLRKSLKPEAVDQLIIDSLSAEEKAKILGKSMTEEEIEKILREHLSDEDKAKLLAEVDPENAATVIKNVVNTVQTENIFARGSAGNEEYENIVSFPASNAPGVGAGTHSPPQAGADEAREIAEAETELAVAALKNSTPPGKFKDLLKNSSLGQDATAKAIIENLSPEALSKAILASLSPNEIGKIASTQMSQQQLAQSIALGMPKEEFARVISAGLAPREIAHVLSKGLPKRQFAKLISANLPPSKINESVASQDEGLDRKPEQFELTKAQVETLLSPSTTPAVAIPILARVMPKSVARSIFNGDVTQEAISRALEGFLPDSTVAPTLATRLLNSLLNSPAPLPLPKAGEAGPEPIEKFAEPREDTAIAAMAKKLADSKKAIELYIARTRELETRLSASETQKKVAEQEVKICKIKLENMEKTLRSADVASEQETLKSDGVVLPVLEEIGFSSDSKTAWESDTNPQEASKVVSGDPNQSPANEKDWESRLASDGETENSETTVLSGPTLATEPKKARDADASTARKTRSSIEQIEADIVSEGKKLDHDVQGLIINIDKIKELVPEKSAKKNIEGLLGEVLAEKAKINELSRELSAVFRKKEHSFRIRESSLVEELRNAKLTIHQRNLNIERMKELMATMQHKMQSESNSSGENAANEAQMRVKLENNQRQIEGLKEEVERLNRRAHSGPSSQQNAVQQREVTELLKQLAVANKALTAKRQEVDLLKKQLAEKEGREADLKRSVMRLQNEVTTAKTASANAAKKSAA